MQMNDAARARALAQIIRLCPEGIIGVDRKGIINVFNQAAEALTGLDAGQVVGSLHIEAIYREPGMARGIKKLLYSAEHGGPDRLEGWEVTVSGRDGAPVPIRLSALLLRNQDGKEVGSIGFFHDLTRQKQAEAVRAEHQKLDGVMQMARTASHELSQPLQVLMALSADLLRPAPGSRELAELAAQLDASVKRLGNVVHRIQKITRVASTTYVGDTEMIDLDAAGEE